VEHVQILPLPRSPAERSLVPGIQDVKSRYPCYPSGSGTLLQPNGPLDEGDHQKRYPDDNKHDADNQAYPHWRVVSGSPYG
jgi:hypothetical protein